jgi:hypothetical protein
LTEQTVDVAHLCWLLNEDPVPRKRATSEEFEVARDFAAHAWQLSPVLVPRILSWARGAAPEQDAADLTALARAASALAAVQFALCRRVVDEFGRQGIPHALIKGSAVRVTAYQQDPLSRCGLDVDIAVPAPYLEAAQEVTRRQGFVAGSLLEGGRHFRTVDEDERAAVEATHYELACLVRRQRVQGVSPDLQAAIERAMPVLRPWHHLGPDLGCYVTLDVHHGICLDIPVDELVAGARPVPAGDGQVNVPAPAWMLFHTIFKLYWEGAHNYRKGAYQYADLIRLLPLAAEDDQLELIDLLSRYELEAAGFYTLRRLPDEFGVALPPALAAFVQHAWAAPKDAFPSEVNDVGDMWAKIWGHR